MFDKKIIPAGALAIIDRLNGAGFNAYLVGGSVRDLLLSKIPHEWDITTKAPPEEIIKLFTKTVPVGIDFGCVLVLMPDGNYEVTAFRKDESYLDGRRPAKVSFAASLEEDLSRRDFAINAIAYDPVQERLIDVFHGEKDLKEKIIRAVGDPLERFSEDGLRSIRACRFAAQLGFAIEEKTFGAIGKTLDVTKKVAPERIHDEITKMLARADKPSIGFEAMRQSGLLGLFLPELLSGIGVEQPKPFHKWDVYYHSLYSCDAAPKEITARLAALLHDIAKPECKDGDHFYGHDQAGAKKAAAILKRLKFSREIIAAVENLIENHMFNYESNWTDSAVRRFVNRAGLENVPALFSLRLADTAAMEREIDAGYLKELQNRIDRIIAEENALHISDLKIKGEDVMRELSIPPGKKVGEILNFLLERVLEDPALNQAETLLKLVREHEK